MGSMNEPLTDEELRHARSVSGPSAGGLPTYGSVMFEANTLKKLVAEIDRLRAVCDKAYAHLEQGEIHEAGFLLKPDLTAATHK
jgi:hypothetical protein